jgi:hypothetical protein
MDYRAFEQRVLDVLFTTTIPLTPAHMAWVSHVPVAEAEQHLERMVEQGIVRKDCDMETGDIAYVFPQRSLVARPPSQALVPYPTRPLYSPTLAAVLSVLLPGAGHFYSGRGRAGVLWMFATIAGYMALVVPGIILHILCIASASNVPRG